MPSFDHLKQMGKEGRRLEASEVDEVLHRTNKTTFFGNRLCPYAHVAWWSLLEKNVAFDYVHIDLGTHKPEWYKQKVNPYGTVPALYDHGKAVFESVIMAEYLEEKFAEKGTRLLPTDPHERAAVRLLITHFRERTVSPLYQLLKAQTPAEAKLAKELILVEMLALELLYSKHVPMPTTPTSKTNPSSPSSPATSGPFFLGSTFSLAEICIFPFLERLSIALQHYRGLNPLQTTHLPRLQAAYDKIQERPAWKATAQLPAFYIAVYESYAQPVPSSASAASLMSEEGREGGREGGRAGWGWKLASVVSVAGATLPVVGVLSFASFLLGVGIGWSHGRGPARTGKFVMAG